jgi:MFS family permease
VSATALIADHYPTAERGRALGVNDTCAAGISVLVAFIAGPLIAWAGLAATGFCAVLLAVPPLAMLALSGGTKSRRAAAPVVVSVKTSSEP